MATVILWWLSAFSVIAAGMGTFDDTGEASDRGKFFLTAVKNFDRGHFFLTVVIFRWPWSFHGNYLHFR